ncbi:MAG: ATP-binding protein [Bacteroidaceae bacterium]|nr:ATP-binding protein [Bacteroidaceae bacterium]
MRKSFVFGVAAPEYNFTGREQEIKRLTRNFREGINTVLMSPRRIGKTSLVNKVCRDLVDADIVTVQLDIFSCKTEYEFYNQLSAAVLKQTSSRAEKWMEDAHDFLARLTPRLTISPEPNSDFSLSLGITPKTHTPEEVLQLVETIAERKKKRIVVCIDEFQQVGEFGNSLEAQKRMRSVWQHQRLTSYCLFGSRKHLMSAMFQRRNMPFYQFGDLMPLGTISAADWTAYICSHFAERNKTMPEDLAEEICRTVDCYSSYVQQLAWLTFSILEEGETATKEHLQIAIKDLVAANAMLFMEQTANLTVYQMNFLRAMADGVDVDFGIASVREKYDLGSPSNIARLKKALVDKDIVQYDGKRFSFTDPVFVKWLRQQ